MLRSPSRWLNSGRAVADHTESGEGRARELGSQDDDEEATGEVLATLIVATVGPPEPQCEKDRQTRNGEHRQAEQLVKHESPGEQSPPKLDGWGSGPVTSVSQITKSLIALILSSDPRLRVSAFGGKADMRGCTAHVRF